MDDHTPRGRHPRVTVGLPVYNGQDHVGRAIESILAQTLEDFELLVSDNRSEDDTWRICLEYANRDSRVRCVRQETNIGANSNFNALFQLSRSEYFKWAGSDDQWHPTFLDRCADALDQNPAASLAYSGEAYLTDQGLGGRIESELNKADEELQAFVDRLNEMKGGKAATSGVSLLEGDERPDPEAASGSLSGP